LATESEQIGECQAELLLGVTAEVLFDERRSEAVEASSHCRVRGEQVPRSGDGQRDFEWLPGLLHEAERALQDGEGRVPFIQVTDLGLDAERPEQAPSADPEQEFLLQAQLRAAAVELAGDGSMGRNVRRIIAVQQVELHPAD